MPDNESPAPPKCMLLLPPPPPLTLPLLPVALPFGKNGCLSSSLPDVVGGGECLPCSVVVDAGALAWPSGAKKDLDAILRVSLLMVRKEEKKQDRPNTRRARITSFTEANPNGQEGGAKGSCSLLLLLSVLPRLSLTPAAPSISVRLPVACLPRPPRIYQTPPPALLAHLYHQLRRGWQSYDFVVSSYEDDELNRILAARVRHETLLRPSVRS